MQVVVLFIHLRGDAARCSESLTSHRCDDFVYVSRFGFFDGLLPHIDTDVGSFHRIVGQRLVFVTSDTLSFSVVAPLLDECIVGGVLDAHEVVPCSQVTDQRLGVYTAQFFLTH